MHETPEDLQKLQHLLDTSIERAGAFLRSSFEMPEHSLTAKQLVRHLQGQQTLALATANSKGAPRALRRLLRFFTARVFASRQLRKPPARAWRRKTRLRA